MNIGTNAIMLSIGCKYIQKAPKKLRLPGCAMDSKPRFSVRDEYATETEAKINRGTLPYF